jgi:hypothetical protein
MMLQFCHLRGVRPPFTSRFEYLRSMRVFIAWISMIALRWRGLSEELALKIGPDFDGARLPLL